MTLKAGDLGIVTQEFIDWYDAKFPGTIEKYLSGIKVGCRVRFENFSEGWLSRDNFVPLVDLGIWEEHTVNSDEIPDYVFYRVPFEMVERMKEAVEHE